MNTPQLLLISLLLLTMTPLVIPKLMMIQQLFRHGARYPIYPSSLDNSTYADQQLARGQLTANGKNMHYQLGLALYSTYWDSLFGNKDGPNPIGPAMRSNASRFFIKATDINRTIESVQSQLLGIMEKEPVITITTKDLIYSKPQWPNVTFFPDIVYKSAPAFHPMPVHVQKGSGSYYQPGDFLRFYSSQNCPNQQRWQAQNQNSYTLKYIFEDTSFVNALKAISQAVNKTITFSEMGRLYDNYECELYMRKPFLPIFEDAEMHRTFYAIYTLDLYINLFYQPMQLRATATPFFIQTIKNMESVASNTTGSAQWIMYSAHDTTVANMLAALNLTNVECIYDAYKKNLTTDTSTCIWNYPKFSSNIIFQLHRLPNQTHVVRTKYNGLNITLPFCKGQIDCPYQTFKGWVDGWVDLNYVSTCGLLPDNSVAGPYFTILVLLAALLIVVVGAGIVKNLKNSKKDTLMGESTKRESVLSQA